MKEQDQSVPVEEAGLFQEKEIIEMCHVILDKIIFRGKDIQTNAWVEGSLISFPRHCPCITTVEDAYPVPKKSTSIVYPKSVGQYIGRKDNKGKKIFDGDIITADGHYPKLVKFIPENAAFCIANICDFKNQDLWDIWQRPPVSWWNKMYIEVIGNKYDNPELLEE